MYYFCTYFDQNYLVRAMCLYYSIERHCPDFRLYALCMDDESYQRLEESALPRVVAIRLANLEHEDPELKQTKNSRSRVEYFFTCSPCLPLYLLEHRPEIDWITYLDSDLYFFADPRPVYHELEGYSIGITEQRLMPGLRKYAKFGIYNVGWNSFRRDENGLACLRWWRQRCIEWCYEREEDGKYTDQRYLNDWPVRFRGVRVIQHKGANVAPWNVGNYLISFHGDRFWVDDEPLLFYHFHGLRRIRPWLYDAGYGRYFGLTGTRLGRLHRHEVYGAYINDLNRHTTLGPPLRKVRNIEARFGAPKRLARAVGDVALNIFSGSYIILLNGKPR